MTSSLKLGEVERAFVLARSGEYANVGSIRDQLRREGYGGNHIEGPSLIRQLRRLCQEPSVLAERRADATETIALRPTTRRVKL
jgi:hypothetical protein